MMPVSPILLAALSCTPAVEAPAELDELASWLYTYHSDEDPEAMISGIDRLAEWFDDHQTEALAEDWEVTSLEEETVDGVDEVDRTTEGMVALAVFTESVHSVEDAALAMVGTEVDEVYPDTFSDYERQWDSDPDCFLLEECSRTSAYENYTASFPFDIHTTNELQNEYLWVEGTDRKAMVHRNWLLSPPETNSVLLEIDEMFHLNLFLESDGGFVRLQSAWMVVTQEAVNPATAIQAVGNDYRNNSETLDAWLDENAR